MFVESDQATTSPVPGKTARIVSVCTTKLKDRYLFDNVGRATVRQHPLVGGPAALWSFLTIPSLARDRSQRQDHGDW
jgi:hypothetical protein